MLKSYLLLGIAALLPVAACVIFWALEEKTSYAKLPYIARQIITGVFFGGLAIIGTEWGIRIPGAMINARDAAPLCAGLFFGAPAGIIAGVIGGVERWIAVAWGVGSFTRLACSVSTIIAGVYAAVLRRFLFDDRRAGWALAFVTGFVMEVFHLTMVFVTNLNEAEKAAQVVQACSNPMIIANSLSVLLAAAVLSLLSGSGLDIYKIKKTIPNTFQRGLLRCIAVAFAVTTVFMLFIQIGIARNNAENMLKNSLDDLNDDIIELYSGPETVGSDELALIAHNRHVGSNGYVLIADREGNILSASENITAANLAELGLDDSVNFDDAIRPGDTNYAMQKECGDYILAAFLPMEEVMTTARVSLYVNTYMEVLVFAAMFLFIYLMVKKTVVKNINRTNEALAEITDGDLDVSVDVRSNYEFSLLSDGINATVTTLKDFIHEVQAGIERELDMAKDIQASALPCVFPAFPNRRDFDIYANMKPAKEVGGDFYDFYLTGNRLNFLVADVSGKGVPAAMFMMRAKTQLKSLADSGNPVEEVFTQCNKALCEGNKAGMFVTAWMASVDLDTGLLEYANAGHNPPLIKHPDGSFEFVRGKTGFVLAGMDTIRYRRQSLQLHTGDILFMYTDGVTEATNSRTELFGEDRLLEALNAADTTDMQSLCNSVRSKVDEFVGEAAQFDDITVLAFSYNGRRRKTISYQQASIEDISEITAVLESELELLDCPMKATTQLCIAVDEIYSNIVLHAYKDIKGPASVVIEETDDPHGVMLTFSDEGKPYNPVKKEDPDVTLSAQERQIGGLGIYMVKKQMDDMSYEYRNGMNVLHILKKF